MVLIMAQGDCIMLLCKTVYVLKIPRMICYAWNVAANMDEIHDLLTEYMTNPPSEGGFVDWLMERPGVLPTPYYNLLDAHD